MITVLYPRSLTIIAIHYTQLVHRPSNTPAPPSPPIFSTYTILPSAYTLLPSLSFPPPPAFGKYSKDDSARQPPPDPQPSTLRRLRSHRSNRPSPLMTRNLRQLCPWKIPRRSKHSRYDNTMRRQFLMRMSRPWGSGNRDLVYLVWFVELSCQGGQEAGYRDDLRCFHCFEEGHFGVWDVGWGDWRGCWW